MNRGLNQKQKRDALQKIWDLVVNDPSRRLLDAMNQAEVLIPKSTVHAWISKMKACDGDIDEVLPPTPRVGGRPKSGGNSKN